MSDAPATHVVDLQLDARGLNCPLPLLRTKQALASMRPGQVLQLIATDAGSQRDIRRFAEMSGHQLLAADSLDGEFHFWLRKSGD